MSTEEKKAAKTAEALSQAEMAGVAGGKSHSGKSGGGHKLVDNEATAEINKLL